MSTAGGRPRRARGQMVVLFALVLGVVILGVGVVVDGGNALVQRRGSQNASDFAALAGARVVASFIDGDTNNGSDANVHAAIVNAIDANDGEPIVFGAPNGPRYVASNGALLGYVGTGAIPSNAAGVQVSSEREWTPYFLGIIGMDSWTATTTATAKGGYSLAGPPPGSLFPVGVSLSFFQTYPFCSGPISTNPSDPCYPVQLTPGNLNVPGGFGWLKFGCDGYGLGQEPPANAGGCDNSKPFLQGEIGPPSNSYGCCTAVGQPGSPDRIGSLPGNKVSADCSYWIDNEITVTVPIWDTAGGTGQNGWYHIVGFSGFQITGCRGGKDVAGVWRKAFFLGPVSSTPGTPGVPQALGVQLIK
jgi:putative Flp pilus-assembly TadE/G-like protein